MRATDLPLPTLKPVMGLLHEPTFMPYGPFSPA